MILKDSAELQRVRRLALASQGLLSAQPYGKGLAGARKAIAQLGYVQIDTISVVERAHNHVLYSRVPDFKPAMTNQLLLAGDVFEYWSHAAAFLPINDFRFSLPYKHAIKSGQKHWYKNPDKKLMSELLSRIRSDGPLRSRDLESTATKQAGWWDWKPAKKALEQLYMEGDLMVCNREGFQKTYDLTENVLPAGTDTRMPTTEEFAKHLVDQQLRCHGLVSLKGITYLRRNPALRKAVKDIVYQQLTTGSLETVELGDGDSFLTISGILDASLPRFDERLMILSPFDNAVIQRDRLKSIFNFDYQIECYVTEAKRQFGYFSLPLLYRGEFIGRMDCKAHRKDRHFEIKSLHIEQQEIDLELLAAVLLKAVIHFRDFQQCDSVSLSNACPKQFGGVFNRALKALG